MWFEAEKNILINLEHYSYICLRDAGNGDVQVVVQACADWADTVLLTGTREDCETLYGRLVQKLGVMKA